MFFFRVQPTLLQCSINCLICFCSSCRSASALWMLCIKFSIPEEMKTGSEGEQVDDGDIF